MTMMKKLRKMKENQKGFTLVELIVVLVILAILAAMLVPALLGYIDKAKEGKYNEEIHSIYTAMQTLEDEAYAKNAGTHASAAADFVTEINKITDPTAVTAAGTITYKGTTKATNAELHSFHTVSKIENCVFDSQDGKNTVTFTFDTTTGDITTTVAPKAGG